MPPVVGAAGALAGGAAANALMGNQKAPAGGGIPGVTTSKGSGKDGSKGAVPQVDPTIALNYFKEASAKQNAGYAEGINYYGNAVTEAANQIRMGYQQGNSTLQPLSYSSNQALNQQMRMLGLDPIQATASYGDALKTSITNLQNTPGNSLNADSAAYGNQIADLMNQATNIRDPGERAKALSNIQNMINTGNTSLVSGIQSKLDAIKDPTAPTLAQFGLRKDNNGSVVVGPDGGISSYAYYGGVKDSSTSQLKNGSPATDQLYMQYQDALNKYNTDLQNNKTQREQLQAQLDQAKSYGQTLSDYGNQFANSYSKEYDAGYSPEQISNVVSNLPGYQFQLKQGLQAIDRGAASKGMLNSANTALAEQDFGQNQAMNYYNNYMGYLSGITAQGAAATGQIATNQVNEGNSLATLQQQYGQAQMETARAQADYASNMLYQSGVLFNQDAMFNTQLQFQGQQNDLNRASGSQNAALGAASGLMNAQTNQGYLNMAQQNSAGYAQGFLSNYTSNPYAGANYNGATASNGWKVNPSTSYI